MIARVNCLTVDSFLASMFEDFIEHVVQCFAERWMRYNTIHEFSYLSFVQLLLGVHIFELKFSTQTDTVMINKNSRLFARVQDSKILFTNHHKSAALKYYVIICSQLRPHK